MKRLALFLMLAGAVLIAGCAAEQEEESAAMATVSPSEVFITSIIEITDFSLTQIDVMTAAADAAAERVVDGGKIFVMDDETISRSGDEEVKLMPGGDYAYPMHEDWGGFVAEACDRAGGLRHIQPVPLQGKLTVKDVVIVGTIELHPEDQYTQLKEYKDQGALIIVFGSKDSRVSSLGDYFIDNGLASGLVNVMDIGKAEKIGPTGGIANVINKWAFTAEFVAALTRHGKMPTLWQSMFMPGAAVRNEKIGEYYFHPDMDIAPVETAVSGLQYINTVQGYLKSVKANELPKFAEAGKLLAETKKSGGNILAGIIGHFMTSQRRMPGFPVDMFEIVENVYGDEQLKDGGLKAGDVWFHIGYSMYPVRELKYIDEVGAKAVCVFTPGPIDIGEGTPIQPDLSLVDVYIDPAWKHGDAVVEIPGYDTKILPPSGVVQSTCYWMIIGEMLAAM